MTPGPGKLWFWRYILQSRAVLNARFDSLEHEGALIRDFGGGIGCIHPWPSLGDRPLDDQLASLQSGNPLPLAEQALNCAEVDGLARRNGVNLFDRLKHPIPASHWPASANDDPAAVISQGFRAVKLKCGPEMDVNAAAIDRWMEAGPAIRIRLDFNDTGTRKTIGEFWNSLPAGARSAVDFVEDPVPWNPSEWRALREAGMPLAADRDLLVRAAEADWLIVKPAVINPVKAGEVSNANGQRLVFTSYMDHAIGQMYAAYRASEWAGVFPDQVTECGLLTHELFEPDPFFERLSRKGPRLFPPSGTGLGFDDLLDSLPWEKLI